MSFPRITVQDVAAFVDGKIVGNRETVITGVNSLELAKAGELTFLARKNLMQLATRSPAAVILVGKGVELHENGQPTLIVVDDPYFSFIQVIKKWVPAPAPPAGIHPTSKVAANASIGENVSIGPFCVIADGSRIGDEVQIEAGSFIGAGAVLDTGSRIFAHVTIHHGVEIGKRVQIQSGTVIGSDGFGYVPHGGSHHKIPHLGRVVIEDDVEIGANCCIDRGTFGVTLIRRGAKLDNLIHIAHNVEIGENTLIAAQTGISGSTKIGRDVTIAGQVGLVGHIEIGDQAVLGAQAGVTKSIPSETVASGYPARNHMQARREEAALRRLPDLIKRVRAVEKILNSKSRDHHDFPANGGNDS